MTKSLLSTFLVLTTAGCSVLGAGDTTNNSAGPSESLFKEGRLVDCAKKPNCVSTQASTPEHAIVPYTYSKPMDEAREALKREMAKIPRATLIKEDGPYLHYECRSAVMKFTDDVEFLFNEETKTLQFRSASRVGYSDWGVNRKRMEDIRNKILGHI